MSDRPYKIGNYAVPLIGSLSGLPMKVIDKNDRVVKLQHPSTGQVVSFKRIDIRPGRRREIIAVRPI